MTQFSLRVLLLLSLGHCITDIYQGGLPALLPFLKDKLALSYTMTGVIMILANASGGLMVGFAIGAGGIGVTLLGIIADHFGVLRALQSMAVLPVVAFMFSMILRYPVEQKA